MKDRRAHQSPTNANDSGPASPIAFGLDVQTRIVDGAVVLAVRGALDDYTAPLLIEAMDTGVDAALSTLIVDLSGLDFLSSAGMAVLLRGHQAAGKAKRFGVVADGPTTSRPMKLVGLDQELRLYSTLNEALADAS